MSENGKYGQVTHLAPVGVGSGVCHAQDSLKGVPGLDIGQAKREFPCKRMQEQIYRALMNIN